MKEAHTKGASFFFINAINPCQSSLEEIWKQGKIEKYNL
jgi:hypothetical protein